MRLNKQKEYENEKRSQESPVEREIRHSQDIEYHKEKRSAESHIEKRRRLNKDKVTHKKTYRQSTKDWKEKLIDKASLTHIFTSECRYRPKASMVVVTDKMFTSEQMRLLASSLEYPQRIEWSQSLNRLIVCLFFSCKQIF